MQQMGNGYTDIGTLVSFLDLPTCAETVAYNLQMVERVLGPVQLIQKDASEINSLQIELDMMVEKEAKQTYECTIEDKKHPPLPMVKGSYGKYQTNKK